MKPLAGEQGETVHFGAHLWVTNCKAPQSSENGQNDSEKLIRNRKNGRGKSARPGGGFESEALKRSSEANAGLP